MKKTYISSALGLGLGMALLCTAQSGIAATPPNVVVSPSPVVVAPPMAPSSYIWAGNQYVGVVGNRYYYLTRGNAWMPMDQARMRQFQQWTKSHSNWRSHTIRNLRYNNMGRGNQPQPMKQLAPNSKAHPSSNVVNQPPQAHTQGGQNGPPQ